MKRQRTPSLTATRIAEARRAGHLVTRQDETWLRDRWAQDCSKRQALIANVIMSSTYSRGSVRLNFCCMEQELGEAGLAVARAIAAEHGGAVYEISATIVDVSRLPLDACILLVERLADRALWFTPQKEGRR